MTTKKKRQKIMIELRIIKKPKSLSKWLGLFCITKDRITKGKILSINMGIANIRVFGKSLEGIAHYPIKDILYLMKL